MLYPPYRYHIIGPSIIDYNCSTSAMCDVHTHTHTQTRSQIHRTNTIHFTQHIDLDPSDAILSRIRITSHIWNRNPRSGVLWRKVDGRSSSLYSLKRTSSVRVCLRHMCVCVCVLSGLPTILIHAPQKCNKPTYRSIYLKKYRELCAPFDQNV